MIAARKMKKNHPMAQTCYTNLLMGVVSVIGVHCYDHISFDIVTELSVWSWVLIGLAGLFTIFENTAKFMAFRYEEASKLQKLAFLPNVWNFSIDVLKHTTFGTFQLAGFLLLFVFYTYELIRFYFFDDQHGDEDKTIVTLKDDEYLKILVDGDGEDEESKSKIERAISLDSGSTLCSSIKSG